MKLPEGKIKEDRRRVEKKSVAFNPLGMRVYSWLFGTECGGHPVCECVLQSLSVVLGPFGLECV